MRYTSLSKWKFGLYEEFGKVSEKLLIDKYLTLMGKYVPQIPNEEMMKL